MRSEVVMVSVIKSCNAEKPSCLSEPTNGKFDLGALESDELNRLAWSVASLFVGK